jgi:hypothetical protein
MYLADEDNSNFSILCQTVNWDRVLNPSYANLMAREGHACRTCDEVSGHAQVVVVHMRR